MSLQGGQQQVANFADSLVELHGICEGADVVSSVLLSLSPSWPLYVSAPASFERLTLSPHSEQTGNVGALAIEIVRKLGPAASVGLGGCALLTLCLDSNSTRYISYILQPLAFIILT